ncbi:MAG TPA: hypothetical protein VIA80_12340, partial [Hyphomonadaceae bacterium]
VWVLGTTAILLRGLATGRFLATIRGLAAAFGDLGPALEARGELKRRRKARVGEIAAALSWDPFRFLARRPDVRPFRISPAPPSSSR